MTFHPHNDFDQSSYKPHCAITKLPKQKGGLGVQDHEVDDWIFRGPELFAPDGRGEWSLGFFDVRKQAIQEAAETYLHMVSAAAHAEAVQRANHFRAEYEAARQETESLKDQLRAMILGNAEMITEVSGLQEALESAYAELYPDGEDLGGDVYDLSDDDLLSLEALAEAEAELS